MNILFITNYFPKKNNTQEAIFLYWRAKELIKAGHKVTVLKWNQDVSDYFMKPYNLLDLNDPILNIDIPVFPIHSIDLMLNPLHKKKTYQWIKSNFNVVHFHWLWSMTVFPTIQQWGIPYVVTCHGSDIYRMGESFNQLAIGRWLNKKVMKMQMKRVNQANHVIFVSQDIMSAAKKKGVTSTSFSVIPNGYNQDVFHALNRAKNTKKIIGFVGNLIPIKRAEKLPEIIKLIIEKDKSVHAIIIGDGHLMTSMEADCEQFKDHVSFTGRLPANEVAHFMRTMDVLMLPSRSESFGCVIKEAQACGASVIGSDAGGIPEVIGTGGLVINEGPQFEHRFAEGVVQLLNHPIQATILKKESESFRWEHTMQLEEAIYHGVINSKR